MLVKREWNEVPELFKTVAEVLVRAGKNGDLECAMADEDESSYRQNGFVIVEHGRRRFYLELMEEV